MHYKNGRLAKNGDKVVWLSSGGSVVAGVLYNISSENNFSFAHGRIATMSLNDPDPMLSECLHADDIMGASIPAPDEFAPKFDPALFPEKQQTPKNL